MNRSAPLLSTVAALCGVGFAALLFLSFVVTDPLREATDQELLAWWSDAGRQRETIISMYMMLFAAPLFLVFLTQLCVRLRSAGEEATNWSGLVFGAGVAFVALLTVSAFSRGVLAQSIRFTDEPIPGPDTLRYATTLSQAAVGIAAVPFAAVTIGFASLTIVRTNGLPRWLGWLGLAVAGFSLIAVALLVGALVAPLIVVWVVAASFVIWRTRNAVSGDDRAREQGAAASVTALTR